MPKTDSSRGLSGVLLANGTVPLTANWNMGAFTATFTKTGATAATVYDAFVLSNTTAATVGAQQYSPALHFIGQGWKTAVTAASQQAEYRNYLIPVQGASLDCTLTWERQLNGAGWTTLMSIGPSGFVVAPGITSSGAISGASFSTGGAISGLTVTSTRGAIATTSTDGVISTNTTAATSGIPIQYSARIRWTGNGWTGAASQAADFVVEVQPVNGTTPITANWVLKSQINAAGYNNRLLITDSGNVTISTGNLTLGTAGNALFITEGSNGRVGQTTLVAGTKAITITGLTTSSRAFVTLVSPSGVALTTTYQGVCTANTLTIQANVAAGTINASDVSVLNYFVLN